MCVCVCVECADTPVVTAATTQGIAPLKLAAAFIKPRKPERIDLLAHAMQEFDAYAACLCPEQAANGTSSRQCCHQSTLQPPRRRVVLASIQPDSSCVIRLRSSYLTGFLVHEGLHNYSRKPV